MNARNITRYIGLTLVLAIGLWPTTLTASVPVFESSEQVLKRYQIAITERALISALFNDSPVVRSLAAEVLAKRWPKTSRQPIEQALEREMDDSTRIRMAYFLAEIGDDAGRQVLIGECHRVGAWGSMRIFAARELATLNDDSCIDAVIDVLRSPTDPLDTNAKYEAIKLIPAIIGHLGQKGSDEAIDLVANALGDPAPNVRSIASGSLVRLKCVNAILKLEAAIASEEENDIRIAMENDLTQLRQLKQNQPPH
jgi:HEAT repeat protein